jgi:hypothetical protein
MRPPTAGRRTWAAHGLFLAALGAALFGAAMALGVAAPG